MPAAKPITVRRGHIVAHFQTPEAAAAYTQQLDDAAVYLTPPAVAEAKLSPCKEYDETLGLLSRIAGQQIRRPNAGVVLLKMLNLPDVLCKGLSKLSSKRKLSAHAGCYLSDLEAAIKLLDPGEIDKTAAKFRAQSNVSGDKSSSDEPDAELHNDGEEPAATASAGECVVGNRLVPFSAARRQFQSAEAKPRADMSDAELLCQSQRLSTPQHAGSALPLRSDATCKHSTSP
jgi:hypothetical protein